MNADESKQTQLTKTSTDEMSPVWSPDGKRIYFTSKRDGNREIYVMKADGSDQKNITKNNNNPVTVNDAEIGTQLKDVQVQTGKILLTDAEIIISIPTLIVHNHRYTLKVPDNISPLHSLAPKNKTVKKTD